MMNWKGCGKKRAWPNLRYYPSIFPGTEENHENSIRITGLQAEI
jgi:hypothetical protein